MNSTFGGYSHPHSHSLFPTAGLQFLSAFIHFFGVTILTWFIAVRLSGINLFTKQGWERLSWPRLCVVLVLVDSYLFLFSAGLLLFGIGMQRNRTACATGIYLCVTFYTTSKVLMYLFLTEKVYIVWGHNGARRMRTPVYLLCIGTVSLYLAVILAMYFGRIAEFRPHDTACEIGLKPTASLPLLAYDLYINVLLTLLFLWPLLRVKIANPRMKRVATRTLVAAVAALTTSTINITVLTVLNGRELGWICLGSCGSDVVFNAAALFWVTSAGNPQALTATAANSQLATVDRQKTTGSPLPAASAAHSKHMSQRTDLKPFHLLRSKGSSVRMPAEFQIHVTTTSEVETSPPIRTIELDHESMAENQRIESDMLMKRNSEMTTTTQRTEETKIESENEKV